MLPSRLVNPNFLQDSKEAGKNYRLQDLKIFFNLPKPEYQIKFLLTLEIKLPICRKANSFFQKRCDYFLKEKKCLKVTASLIGQWVNCLLMEHCSKKNFLFASADRTQSAELFRI